jgi:phage terminase large subunit
MPFQETTATKKIFELKKRIRGVSGGTSASKTISILVWLIDYCQTFNNKLVSVVSESFPHLKRGAMRDFLNIMQQHNYFKDVYWNKTDYTYQFETASKLEFFSADQPSKVRGPRRDVLFINEANNIPLETYTQLEIRTREVIWLDWNPVQEFWWYTDIAPQLEHDFLTLTYKDNEALEQSIVETIEARKGNKNWWRVYGMGLLGEVEGKIYTDWQIIDSIPHEARLERYGIDFGYSNDPTALVAVYKYNNGIILDEIEYKKGLLNSDIAAILKNQPHALVIADSAEPKSIDELKSYGITIQPSTKGKGSVLQGIQKVQDQRISVTKRSLNVIKEYRNYLWEEDKDGKIINTPSPILNHAMDAIRYAVVSLNPPQEQERISSVLTRNRESRNKWRVR